jgi:hypothetical protein
VVWSGLEGRMSIESWRLKNEKRWDETHLEFSFFHTSSTLLLSPN